MEGPTVKRRGTRVALLAALALLLLGAGVALAVQAPPGTYKGKTDQKRPVTVKVGDGGQVVHFDIGWQAKCKKPHKFWTASTQFPNSGTTDKIANSIPYTSPAVGGYSGRVTPNLTGKFTTATTAHGKFKAHVKVMKNGKKVDSCKVSTKWHAKA
ncbi:MAG: hypothetical protein QOK25_453 [Thermoleophilaceae bacterium]|nr:hypothetical protein [Thermoleophilaceae bacterium]